MKEEIATESHDEVSSRREAQDELIISGLATGLSDEQAGGLANLSGRSVSRRMTDPVFARRVADRRGEQVVALAGQLTALVPEAVDAIRSGMDDDLARNRMAAGKLILDQVFRLRHGYDLEVAVAEIREHLGMEG